MNSRLQFTVNLSLAEFLPTLEASFQSHIKTSYCLPYFTGHLKLFLILTL